MNFKLSAMFVSKYWEMYENIAECNTINYIKKQYHILLF